MTQDLPEHILQPVSSCILSHTGLFFPQSKWNLLQKGIKCAAAEQNMDVLTFVENLQKSLPSQVLINSLVSYLTIGETYFLRDKNLFQTLKDHILLEIIDSKQPNDKTISFLSAGCATGEEPYSIAIFLNHMFPILKDWKINIIGTDINPTFLEKARQGIYSRWSLRITPEQIIKKYFIQTDANRFEIVPHIKRMVKFKRLNLMDPDYQQSLNIRGEMDIVFCRNVLMYFDEACRNRAIENLAKLITIRGWFIAGPAESGFIQTNGLAPVKFSNVILHQKKPDRSDGIPSSLALFKFDDRTVCPSFNRPSNKPSSVAFKKHPASTAFRRPQTDVEIYEDALRDYEKGNYNASAEKLSKVLALLNHGDSILIETELMVLLAKSYANIGDLDNAGFWCRKAIESEKLNPEIHFLQSSIFQGEGKGKEAIQSLKHAIYLDPDFIMAHFLMGLLLLGEKNAKESRKSLINALSLLKNKDPEEVLPFSEGMTAARLIETINAMVSK
jgi:chemotaxis protein methyltransferase CheR